jgi:hypothetical protein
MNGEVATPGARGPRRRFLVGLACAAAGLPSWAGVDRASAERILKSSGLWLQLAGVAGQVRAGSLAGARNRGRTPGGAELERLSRAIESAYSAQHLRSVCIDSVGKDLDAAYLPALTRWYEGVPGRTIAALEVAQSKRNSPASLEHGADLLRSMASSRRRLLDELVLVTRAAEVFTHVTIGTALASHQPLGLGRHQLMRAASSVALASFAQTYSSLPDAQLEGYLGFLKSEAGEHYIAVTSTAFERAMLSAAKRLSSDLSRKSAST